MENHPRKIATVIIFGIFFGLLEAIVVIYLRQLFGPGNTLVSSQITPDDIAFTLGFITFLKSSASILITQSQRILALELWRELSTIAMLVSLAFIAGRTLRDRIAYFLLAFGIWDVFYYVFLKIISGWPAGLLDIDVYFLIPVAWIGPVVTPLTISIVMILGAIRWLRRADQQPKLKSAPRK